MNQQKWDLRFLDLAKLVSGWSKDPSTRVGAVIVRPRGLNAPKIVSVGFNGFPSGIEDEEDVLNDRELKYKITIHGEVNALISAAQCVRGCWLYTFPFLPCSNCASIFIEAGIKRVVAPSNYPERWKENLALSTKNLAEAGVSMMTYDFDVD